MPTDATAESEAESDQRLFRRLERIRAAAGSLVARDGRRRLLAMEGDVRALRDELQQRADRLAGQISAANAQVNAVTAYARCASLRHRSSDDRPTASQRSN